MSDTPDFLSDEPSSAPAVTPEAPAAPEPAPQEQPQAAAPPAPAPAAPAAEGEEPPAPHHVPLSTFLDMRDRLNQAEARAKEVEERQRRAEQEALRRQAPDRNQDPDAFEDFRAEQMAQAVTAQNFRFSKRLAEVSHGKDAVQAAYDWGVKRCDEDPLFNQRVATSEDPFDFIIAEWKRDKLVSQLSDTDFEAFQQWKAQQAGQPPAPATPAAPAAPPRAPRPSLAGAPSAGRSSVPEARDGESTFERMFGS
jgi:hypothetical protein